MPITSLCAGLLALPLLYLTTRVAEPVCRRRGRTARPRRRWRSGADCPVSDVHISTSAVTGSDLRKRPIRLCILRRATPALGFGRVVPAIRSCSFASTRRPRRVRTCRAAIRGSIRRSRGSRSIRGAMCQSNGRPAARGCGWRALEGSGAGQTCQLIARSQGIVKEYAPMTRLGHRAGGRAQPASIQSASCSPSTRANSRRLLVARIRPAASAWAAIQRSLLPMTSPRRSSSARMAP